MEHLGSRELGLDWMAGIWPMAAAMVLLTVLVMFWATLTGCRGLDVLLPEARTPGVIPDREPFLTITLRADGSTFIRGSWVPEGSLGEVLRKMLPESRTAVVSADSRLRFSGVTEVLAAASAAGFSQLYLEVEGDPVRAWFRPRAASR